MKKKTSKMAIVKTAIAKTGKVKPTKRVQKYDGAQVNGKRRTPPIEIKTEDYVLPPQERLQGIANIRDVERNYSSAKAIITQLKTNIVGTSGKCQINAEGGEQATKYFAKWAKNCSGRNDDNWSEILSNLISARFTAGDSLIVIDDNWLNDDAKLYVWESDQICSMDGKEFEELYGKKGWTQESGIVRDGIGAEMGYFVCKDRGKITAKKDELTFLERNAVARLVKAPIRNNQGRGIADLLTCVNDFADLYMYRSKEIQSACVAASFIGKIIRGKKAATDDEVGMAMGAGEEVVTDDEGVTTTTSEGGEEYTYKRLYELAGGAVEDMHDGDDFHIIDHNRPNINGLEFSDRVMCAAGAAVGMAKAYALVSADSSYTSFRGDMILTWQSCFVPGQKWLERKVCDWVAIKVLSNAIRQGEIDPLPEGWEDTISWIWPVMPSVDELKEITAWEKKMKLGKSTYQEMNGPNYRQIMKQQGKEKKEALKEEDLNYLSTYESTNGVPIEQYEDESITDSVNPNKETP